MNEVSVGTLRIRGPHARRLAAVAARALPAALDRALADLPDVEMSSVHVLLEFDVPQYDDATLATLWADAIRAELLAAGPARRPAGGPPATPASRQVGPAGPDAVLAEARRRLAASGATERAVPAALLRLGDPATARAVATALGPREWSRLLRSLSGALAPTPHREPGLRARPGPAPTPGAGGPRAAPAGAAGAAPGAGGPAGQTASLLPSADERPGGPRATLELLATLAEIVPPGQTIIDLATVTRAAGLVLLYPWLPEHCRRAERLHPRLDPVDVREAALAALVAPDDPGLADDLLVGFLAGRTDLVGCRDRTRVPLAHEGEVRESAAEVLASYVSLLPGFENSSAPFIRENWIARLGALDLDRDPALLTIATHPLDVVFPRLPYPVGLLKLPWSPLLSVRFRP